MSMTSHAQHHRVPGAEPGKRYWLWIDGVGGYLVCEAARVVIGQPVAGEVVDVPVLADISRRHLELVRDDEGYFVEPLRPVRIGGRSVDSPASVAPGTTIELGGGVRIRLVRPHPLSRTVRIELVSHHRTSPSSDGVVWFAESCLLGPGPQCHVACPHWEHEVTLFRQSGRLYCRTPGDMEIDGQPYVGQGPLARWSRVVGPDFCFRLEEIET